LTNVTSLLIPQRMNSFNKEEKVNFVKWYYSGLPFRDIYLERPIPNLTCRLWLSPRLHFPAIATLTNSLILFFLKNKFYLSGEVFKLP
jgi:hypothetical protein